MIVRAVVTYCPKSGKYRLMDMEKPPIGYEFGVRGIEVVDNSLKVVGFKRCGESKGDFK